LLPTRGHHDPVPLAPPPLLRLRWFTTALAGYGAAALVWLTFGDALPGGRWFAVHLFTLGVLSNAVVALSEHFARALLHTEGPDHRTARFIMLNTGALLVLGFPPTLRYPLAAGATLLAVTVGWLWLDLHRMRATTTQTRFAFVVRGYELACAAFLVGALLGGLLGTAVLRGTWYGASRMAHLHVNVLGWGGLTLLATLVFFGPTLLRTRMLEGAEATGARAVPFAAGGLLLAVTALVMAGGFPSAAWPRWVAAGGLALYAGASTAVCMAVLRAGRAARVFLHGRMIQATCVWFPAIVWGDVVVVALDRPRLFDALGAALIVAVLGQAIAATINYLTPMVWVAGRDPRNAARERLERLGVWRVALLNLGAVLVVASAVAGTGAAQVGSALARIGWLLVAAVLLTQVAVSAMTIRGAAAVGDLGT
jgi:hypothetical protein